MRFIEDMIKAVKLTVYISQGHDDIALCRELCEQHQMVRIKKS